MTAAPAPPEDLPTARLLWRDDRPYSTDFNDIYFSSDAEREVHRVFLDPVNFSARSRNQRLLIAETGFGTGLNFLTAVEASLQAGGTLHWLSCESAPLTSLDARRALTRLGGSAVAAELAADWPPPLQGWHRRVLAGGKIRLSVWHGDATDFLSELEQQLKRGIDHWLLDGFAPDRNPELWLDALLQRLAPLSTPGATVATFTSRGQVRRALQASGFEMRRIDQRPHKRESLAGTLTAAGRCWTPSDAPVQILGAGLAGAWTARALAEQQIRVRLVDPNLNANPAGASQVPASVLHGRLQSDGSPSARLRVHAFRFSAGRCRGWPGVQTLGALQAPGPQASAEKLARIADRYADAGGWLSTVSASEASERAGIALTQSQLWFPDAATVSGPVLISALTDHPTIELADTPLDTGAAPEIAACGPAVNALPGLEFLEVLPVAGQLDLFKGQAAQTALLGQGYAAPWQHDGLAGVAVGSTYEYQPWADGEATARNREHARQLGLPEPGPQVRAFRAERALVSDRTPIVGRSAVSGWWVLSGLGSLGMSFAPWAAEIVASQLLGEPAPASAPLREALSPDRFLARQARRGLRHGARVSVSQALER